jgi:hypothetical protein
VITRIKSYSIPVIRSYDNSNFTTKSNIIKIQGIFSISRDYIILYGACRNNLFHMYILYSPIIFLIVLCIIKK